MHHKSPSLSLYSTIQSAMLLRIFLPLNLILAISSYFRVPTDLTRTKHVADIAHHLDRIVYGGRRGAAQLFGVQEAEGYGHG